MDLEHDYAPTDTFANYCMWFGYRLTHATLGGKGLYKLGDRYEWTDNSRGQNVKLALTTLVSDAGLTHYYQVPRR